MNRRPCLRLGSSKKLLWRRPCHVRLYQTFSSPSRLRSIKGRSAVVAGSIGTLTLATGFLAYVQSPVHPTQWLRVERLDSGTSVNHADWPQNTPVFRERQKKDARTGDSPSNQQTPPSQSRIVSDNGEGNIAAKDPTPWQSFKASFSSRPAIDWSSIGDKIADLVLPGWVQILPGYLKKLESELSWAPGSLADEIWQEAHDPEINPEIIWEANVRVSDELCNEEKSFLRHRAIYTRRGLAKYLDIPEADVHPDDVPIIAMCGSGGGLRALVAGSSSYVSVCQDGLFDCVTYTAGVSGSCWLQALYFTTIAGQSHQKLIRHLKNRLGVHIAFPPGWVPLIASAPTNKYLLSGILEKYRGVPDADFGLVDVYGLLLAARLLVPKGELAIDERDLKISNQRRYTDNGSHPLPIYTAVRHEIPIEEQQDIKGAVEAVKEAKKEAWFQWFETTPYEFWCEELGAGIPIWAVGRKFENGRTVWRENGLALPEMRLPILMGIWGSAFCATLSHYYKEVQPVLRGVLGFTGLDQMLTERDEDMIKVHPIDPATIPNYALGMREQLPDTVPESIFKEPTLKLMDAGMSNNLPIYPLLRPGRNVDILIAFDASADVKTDNWLRVADGYARQRGIKGWPIGSGWPPQGSPEEQVVKVLDAAQAETEKDASDRLAKAQKDPKDCDTPRTKGRSGDLSFCNVWVGTTEERVSGEEPPQSKRVEEDWELMQKDAGIAVVYFPFLPNPKVADVDPQTSDFMSTWNFVYTPEQVDKVVALAKANFEEGKEQTRRTVRAVYERKKAKRLERERERKALRRQWKLRMGVPVGRKGYGDQGDHFS